MAAGWEHTPRDIDCSIYRHSCKIKCCKPCSFCNQASAKERNKSWLGSCEKQSLYIKICQRCFFCHSVVLCPTCGQCPSCCTNSICGVPTSKLLANLAGNGCRSENSSKPERGLHPSLSDPAKPYKVSHCHKLLCQSPQEQLPVGGITSAYRQKRNRTGPQSNISRVFQPAVFSTQTQQQMETYTGPEQAESFPQGGEIQNGDTGNYQDIPPARGVGNLSRLQGCLLPHTDTGTIQEISEISCPGSDLPIQGTALWSVHSAHGVHYISQGGETDGHTQGYKDPPIPRRLVSESQLPLNLSPAYTNSGQNVSGSGLAGEHRKIRTGTQTSLQLCRLPVRPQVRPGQTDTGPVAKPSGENTSTFVTTGLSGPAIHVPDRPANGHRKTSSPRPTTHETHTVASQKQLEGTGISREGYPSTQVPAPTSLMVARGKQCAPRSTITPNKTCASKEGWGAHLNECTARGSWSVPESRLHINYLELKAVFLALKEFQDLCVGKIVLLVTDNTTVVAYINKEGGMRSGPLCALLWRILTWCSQRQVTLKARHIPGRLNVIADKLSRLSQTIQTEWSLLPEIFQKLCSKWHRPQIDLFATRFNHKLPQFVSPVPDSLAVAVDALTLPWEELDAYAFPPTAILGKVVEKLQDSPCKRLILIAPGWPNMPWFWDLVSMSSQVPLSLPNLPNLLTQPFSQIPHRNLTYLNLHAWLLEPHQSMNRASLRQWQQELRLLKEDQPDQSMRQSGPFLQSVASLIRWTSGHHL